MNQMAWRYRTHNTTCGWKLINCWLGGCTTPWLWRLPLKLWAMMKLNNFGTLFKNILAFNRGLKRITTDWCFSKLEQWRCMNILIQWRGILIISMLLNSLLIIFNSFVSHITAGLDDKYTPIVCVIRSQNLTWSEIQLELLSFEQRLERRQALKSNISINLTSMNLPSVDVAQAEGQRVGSQPKKSNNYKQYRGFASNTNSN